MRLFILTAVLLTATVAWGQSTRPADAPTTAPVATADVQPPSADALLTQMLRPSDTDRAPALVSEPAPVTASVSETVSPGGSSGPILREGTDILDRVGRLHKTADGQQEEFTFEADGRALRDPPVVILPNLTLMQMETALTQATHDLRFRISGTVTEYHGRNYILLEKFVVVQDKNQEF